MNASELLGTAQHRAWLAGEHPPVESLGGGLWSVPVPMPEHPLRYVNCHVLETTQGPVLVDPGWPTDLSVEHLEAGLQAVGSGVDQVHGILVTHAHADHVGIAGTIRDRSGCWIAMHWAEAELVARLADGSAVNHRNTTWMDLCGVPVRERRDMCIEGHLVAWAANVAPDRMLEDGDDCGLSGRQVNAVWTPGHTPGHLCFLLEENRLLTGDAVLPRITSHVGSYAEGKTPLADHLASLARLDHIDGEVDVLPGHEYRFRGLRARTAVLRKHHEERANQVVTVLDNLRRATVFQVAADLTWSRSWEATTGPRRRLAVAETLAHLEWLGSQGRVRVDPASPLFWSSVPGRHRRHVGARS